MDLPEVLHETVYELTLPSRAQGLITRSVETPFPIEVIRRGEYVDFIVPREKEIALRELFGHTTEQIGDQQGALLGLQVAREDEENVTLRIRRDALLVQIV